MTYATLEAISPTASTSEYIETGTDQAEARRWKELMNEPVGEDIDYSDDLEGMGLR